jgi:hypothetical protein
MHTLKKGVVLCISVASFVCQPGILLGSELPCDAAMGKQLGIVYALAVLDPEQFVRYVQQEKDTLASTSFRRCIKAVADAVLAAALNMPSSQERYERAMDIASRAGVPELGPKVADDMTKTQGNSALVALALTQLSQVLGGELAYESSILYECAGVVQVMSQSWVIGGGEDVMPGFWSKYLQMLFELTRWQVEWLAGSLQ